MGRDITWVNSQGFAVGGDCGVQVALNLEGCTEVVVGKNVIWVEFQGLAVGSNCGVQVVLILESIPEIVVGVDVVWVELQSFAVGGNSSVQVALFLERNAKNRMGTGSVGGWTGRLFERPRVASRVASLLTNRHYRPSEPGSAVVLSGERPESNGVPLLDLYDWW